MSTVVQGGIRMCICGLLANAMLLHAQEFTLVTNGVPPGVPADGANHIFRTGGAVQAGLVINGFDFGAVLLKACDLDQDGKAALGEVKYVASACFKLWDTNADSNLSQVELAVALKGLFPAPPAGGGFGIRRFTATPGSATNEVFVSAPGKGDVILAAGTADVLVVAPGSADPHSLTAAPSSTEELPTPDSQLAKHIFAGADANQDGLLSLQEVSEFLDKNFSQWDQNSSGSLDEHEFAMAFGQLAIPDGAATSPVRSQ